jgi:hypothetical protein
MSGEGGRVTIPPAVRFRFEQFTSRLCDLAKVDYLDRPEKSRQWMIELEKQWRTKAEKLDTDLATEETLVEFGNAETVARGYRRGLKGFWERLLYYERYKLHRLVFPAAVCLLHHWVRQSSSVRVTIISTHDFRFSYINPNWDYYVGILFVATFILPSLLTKLLPRWDKLVRFVASFVALWLFWVIFRECIESVGYIWDDFNSGGWHRPAENVPMWEDAAAGVLWVFALLFEVVALLVMVPVVASEIFDLPSIRRRKIEERERQRA